MENIYNNLIEYSGISDYIPKDINCFKEFTINSTINVFDNDLKVKEIIKVNITPNIKSTRAIITPVGKSLEGQVLTGKKYIIEGELNIRVDFLSETGRNKIHCLYHVEYFSSSMILHKDIINRISLIPSIFIEDIHGQLVEDSEILVITTILTTLEK
ncbi:MAG: hypothetical protein ACRC68_12370 [Clostridium sp.]